MWNFPIGRSIIFASWDGEEFGQLGSTAWLYSHAKELRSRAIVYIDLDNLLQGNDKIHIASSPLLKQVIMEAASSIECPENSEPKMEKSQEDKLNNSRCTLYDTLFSSATTSSDHNNSSTGCISVDGSPFQSILGISSLEVAMKNDYQGKEFCTTICFAFTLMPCYFTGPKMFWSCLNFLCQTKNLFTYCGSQNILR